MGDPKKTKKHYETPKKPYDKGRIEEEREIVRTYGLKNKRKLWRIETILRKKRENARKLLALPLEERLRREKELLDSLARLGLLSENATLDDVLMLNVESLLERRLQTIVLRKGLANTAIQARQFIVHGHIAINGKRVSSPSYLVTVEEEKKIAYYGKKMELGPKDAEPAKEVKKGKGVKKEFEEALPKGKEETEKGAAAGEETVEKKVKGEEKKEEAGKKAVEAQKKDKKEAKPEKKDEPGEKEAEGKEKKAKDSKEASAKETAKEVKKDADQ